MSPRNKKSFREKKGLVLRRPQPLKMAMTDHYLFHYFLLHTEKYKRFYGHSKEEGHTATAKTES